MLITVNLKDTVVKSAIENMLESGFHGDFDSAAIKRAGLPTKAALIKQLLADDKFMDRLRKELSLGAAAAMEEDIYDSIFDIDYKPLQTMYSAAEEAAHELYRENHAKEEKSKQDRMEEMRRAADEDMFNRFVELLASRGMKIVKE
jgi:hypothetical protein